ncbi:MAG: hypothetical protein H0X51_10020 [Parachlamydiaceae bacterium]|nr:hypothetical protein [Parachlamydiaceae bacterium]
MNSINKVFTSDVGSMLLTVTAAGLALVNTVSLVENPVTFLVTVIAGAVFLLIARQLVKARQPKFNENELNVIRVLAAGLGGVPFAVSWLAGIALGPAISGFRLGFSLMNAACHQKDIGLLWVEPGEEYRNWQEERVRLRRSQGIS